MIACADSARREVLPPAVITARPPEAAVGRHSPGRHSERDFADPGLGTRGDFPEMTLGLSLGNRTTARGCATNGLPKDW